MKVWYLIGHRDVTKDNGRTRNLEILLDNLIHLPAGIIDGGILVIDQVGSLDEVTCPEKKEIECIIAKNSGPYNRSWGFNVGVRHLQKKGCLHEKDILIFADNDVIMNKNDWIQVLTNIREDQSIVAFSPYRQVYDLPRDHFSVKHKEFQEIGPENGTVRRGTNMAGGIFGMNYGAFLRVGGWMEDFKGWGYEDAAMSHLVYRVLEPETVCQFPNNAFHLWHTHEKHDNWDELREHNGMILKHLQMSTTETVLSRIIRMRATFGLD